jgi:hypothetical protein
MMYTVLWEHLFDQEIVDNNPYETNSATSYMHESNYNVV